jgi:hypothetical protein
MRLGLTLTLIIGLKRSLVKGEVRFFFSYLKGFLEAKRKGISFIVDPEQGKFIRNIRWKGIFHSFKLK